MNKYYEILAKILIEGKSQSNKKGDNTHRLIAGDDDVRFELNV